MQQWINWGLPGDRFHPEIAPGGAAPYPWLGLGMAVLVDNPSPVALDPTGAPGT